MKVIDILRMIRRRRRSVRHLPVMETYNPPEFALPMTMSTHITPPLSLLPVEGPVTSMVGIRARHPVTGRRNVQHSGVDIAVPTGTPVRSTAAGIVTFAGEMGGYGQVVDIAHGDRSTRYAHLSAIHVAVGQRVASGETIGLSGRSGRVTGPHLHYEVRVNGVPVDPLTHG